MDYASTHPDAIVMYHTSDMVLAGHNNASYLSESKACSQVGGHFFMSNNTAKPLNNGAIHTISQIIKAVMSSAAEAEVGSLYINCREAVPAPHTLEFMCHPQPPTRIQMDDTTALGIVNKNVIKKMKAIDMKYHWLRKRESQGQFRHYWAPGKENNGIYVTKHHATIHHQATHNFLHKHLYLTSTMPMTHWQSSCSNGVLDIYYTTVRCNLHTYSKLYNEPLRPPVCTTIDRDQQSHHIFPVPRK